MVYYTRQGSLYFLHSLLILRFLGSILHVLQYRLLHKTQVNSLTTKETLVAAPHKAVEKARMVNGT